VLIAKKVQIKISSKPFLHSTFAAQRKPSRTNHPIVGLARTSGVLRIRFEGEGTGGISDPRRRAATGRGRGFPAEAGSGLGLCCSGATGQVSETAQAIAGLLHGAPSRNSLDAVGALRVVAVGAAGADDEHGSALAATGSVGRHGDMKEL